MVVKSYDVNRKLYKTYFGICAIEHYGGDIVLLESDKTDSRWDSEDTGWTSVIKRHKLAPAEVFFEVTNSLMPASLADGPPCIYPSYSMPPSSLTTQPVAYQTTLTSDSLGTYR